MAAAAGHDDDDGSALDHLRRVVSLPRGMTTVEFVERFPDDYAQFMLFEDSRGRQRGWRLGSQTADAFLATADLQRPATDVIFHSRKVRIFFPVVPALMPGEAHSGGPGAGVDGDAPYFAVRSTTLRGAPTLAWVLRAVEVVAAQAMALHLDSDLGRPGATYGDARRCLRNYVACRLLCRRVGGGNHVYVRL